MVTSLTHRAFKCQTLEPPQIQFTLLRTETLHAHYFPICHPYMIQIEHSSIVNWYVNAFTNRELCEVLSGWMGTGALECSLRSFHIENTVVLFQSYIFRCLQLYLPPLPLTSMFCIFNSLLSLSCCLCKTRLFSVKSNSTCKICRIKDQSEESQKRQRQRQ